jgi:hypothetical protein
VAAAENLHFGVGLTPVGKRMLDSVFGISAQRLRMSGDIPPLPQVRLWRPACLRTGTQLFYVEMANDLLQRCETLHKLDQNRKKTWLLVLFSKSTIANTESL